jgi:4-hydroxybenzoate polyprenyltransferase
MPPVLKILVDVAVFRLRRLEMANIAGALAIAVACHLSWAELGVRGLFAFGLNLLVYLNNDWYDLDDDLASAAKNQTKNAYLAAHLREGVIAQLGLLAVLLGVALWWGGGLLLALVAGGGVCWAYSAKLKRVPVLDVLAMIAWGMAMPMVGLAPGHPEGWLLLGQLGLFSGVFESIQVTRDHDADADAGARTTAVVLGVARAKLLVRVMLAASAAYAGLCFAWWLAPLPLCLMVLPIAPPSDVEGISRYWNRVRVGLGLVMLAETALVYLGGAA